MPYCRARGTDAVTAALAVIPVGHHEPMSSVISCDDCSMQHSSACDECIVTFVLNTEAQLEREPDTGLVLDFEQQRVVRWFTQAGMVPESKFESAS